MSVNEFYRKNRDLLLEREPRVETPRAKGVVQCSDPLALLSARL